MGKQNKQLNKQTISNDGIKIHVENKGDEVIENVFSKENKKSNSLKNFADLYNGRSDARSDMSKIVKKDPNRNKKIIAWVVVGLVIILGATLGGFFYFINQEDKFGSDSIDIEEVIPTFISSGDNVGITITIYNRGAVDILDAELIIQYPSDFRFNSSDPLSNNEANNAWSLGVIKSGSSKSINLNGQIFGAINFSKEFKTILNYMPENFSSFFQKNYSFDLVINDSVYDLNLTVPTKVVNGFSSSYSVKITNNSEEEATNLKLSLTIPENLSVTSFDPEPDTGTIWEIDELKSGEEFEVIYEAVVEGAEGDMAEIKAEVGYIGDNNEYIIQREQSAIIFVVNPQLVLDMIVNDSEIGFPVSMGDTLNYKISYQNNSQSEVKDLTITANLQGVMLNWNSLADNNDGIIEDGTISWDPSQIEDLLSLKPGEEGKILFNITLSNSYIFSGDEDINLSIFSSATAVSNNVADLDGGTLEIISNEVENKVNSKLDLRVEGRYYDDEYIKVGDGPIPPAVGETTSYKIYWFLQNGANVVSGVEVMAVLSDDVTWVDDTKVNAGNIFYNSTTRTVTWTINKMPEHVGQFLTELNAVFEISVTPTSSDLGQVLILLNNSQITATDTFTEEEITITQDIISSDLADDPLAIGDGLVVNNTSTNSNSNANSNLNSNTNTE